MKRTFVRYRLGDNLSKRVRYHLSSKVEEMWWSGAYLAVGKWEICTAQKRSWKWERKKVFHSILQHHAIQRGACFVQLQDNDQKHTSKLWKNTLGKNQSADILCIKGRPTQWPDLNPVELLWKQPDCMVHNKCSSRYSNLWEKQEMYSYYFLYIILFLHNKQTTQTWELCLALSKLNFV